MWVASVGGVNQSAYTGGRSLPISVRVATQPISVRVATNQRIVRRAEPTNQCASSDTTNQRASSDGHLQSLYIGLGYRRHDHRLISPFQVFTGKFLETFTEKKLNTK